MRWCMMPDAKLKELLSKCKAGVIISVNEHRNYYSSAELTLERLYDGVCDPEIADDVRNTMLETDTIVEIQFYPDTPIGFYSVYHHDIECALDEALSALKRATNA